jgi:1-deoxy-D-xylulose-5-phosphate reductoisomerase
MVRGMKKLAILGSTGSIGRQALEVVRAFPDRLQVVALACGTNLPLLKEQTAEFKPAFIGTDPGVGTVEIEGTHQLSLEEIASHSDVDLLIVATSGRAGLQPTLSGIRAAKRIGLANKEVLVMAGELVMREARERGVEILPIDSEHSAIWQCLRGEDLASVLKVMLTASGGPFRGRAPSELASVTPEEALSHPTWEMGVKVTVDSATLMNKGMEVIEARWLFDVPLDRIEVVVHPQSIVHSLVQFRDGAMKAQLSQPDMRMPIQYALAYPERWTSAFDCDIDLARLGALEFEAVDLDKFPCLRLALEAAERGGTCTAVLSAADEVAVELFLARDIGFQEIAAVVERTLAKHRGIDHPSIDDILAADAWARETARHVC